MLIACSRCHRQYDVKGLAAGSRVRCLCGESLTVTEPTPREAPMLRCASCGATLEEGGRRCAFCGSVASLAERGLGGLCPECLARMPAGARFCCACGVAIAPVGRLRPLHGRPCPRCEEQLLVRELQSGSLAECGGCGGIWLDEERFAHVSRTRGSDAVSRFVTGRASAGDTLPEVPFESTVRYLKCPTCGQIMHRKNFAGTSGVIVDWCKGHGYWFDRHELERIVRFLEDGGLERARERELARKAEQLRVQARRVHAARRPAAPQVFPSQRRTTWLDQVVSWIGAWLD